MLSDLLHCLEAEVIKRDPRITGLEVVSPESKQNRLHIMVSVLRSQGQEIRLPVTVSLEDIKSDNVSVVMGAILQAVDLGTWGSHDFKQVRESVRVTA